MGIFLRVGAGAYSSDSNLEGFFLQKSSEGKAQKMKYRTPRLPRNNAGQWTLMQPFL